MLKQNREADEEWIVKYDLQYYKAQWEEECERRRQSAKNKKRERARRFRGTHEKNAEYCHRYYETHKEERAEYHRQYREVHKEQCAEFHRQWCKANPEKARERGRRRRARKASATIGPVNEAAIYELYNHTCVYCGATQNLTLDHIEALNNGGPHSEDNLVVACGRCNSSKNARLLMEWLETQPYSQAWVM